MSTTYHITVGCDEKRSKDCWRELHVSVREPREIDFLGTTLFQEGWLRGYTPTGPSVTHDVCPACRPAVEERRPTASEPVEEGG